MDANHVGHLRTVPRRKTAREPAASGIRIGLGALAVLLIAFMTWRVSAEQNAIRSLPSEQRIAIYSRTLAELRAYCGAGRPGPLREHCAELASFIAQFDECADDCVELSRRQLESKPTR